MRNGSWLVFLSACCLAACSPPARVTTVKEILPPSDPLVEPIPPGKPGGVFVQTDPGEPSTFNWLVAEDATSSGYIGQFFEALVSYDPIQEIVVPALAKCWEISPDNQTFTFYLREGLQWSDGQPLTAADVGFTFACIYDSRFTNRLAYDLSDDGLPFTVTVHDALTLSIRTPYVFAPFLQKLSGVPIMPRHLLEPFRADGSLQKQWTVSTAQKNPGSIVVSGPYRLSSYRPGERIVLEPNPYYYKTDTTGRRLPYITHLITQFVKDQNSSTIAFATGQTDAEGITGDNLLWVKRSEGRHHFTVHDRGPSTSSSFIWFNQNPGQNKAGQPYVTPHKLRWFQNTLFRQAISTGIDRQGIIDGVLFGRGTPLWSSESPANTKWYNPHVRQYPYDPAAAKKLLLSAGFTLRGEALHDSQGHRVTFRLVTNQENPIRQAMATVFMENMKALGIEVILQFLDFGALVDKISDTYDYEASLLGLTGGGDPSGGMSVYMSKGRLHQWYPNQPTPATPWEARIDDLMRAQLRTLNEVERKKLFDEVQLIMSEQCPYIYLITPNAYVGLRNKWQNVRLPRMGSILWNQEQLWTPQN
jgi:peptide/nickel transport system substrate-binding protein